MDWSDWNDASFRRARESRRPILLALQASWSSWSRILEREAYADPDIVRLVGEEFVPIRVDIDRRPDVNDRYNPGAVPAIALLNPDGVLLYATAYMDARELRLLLGQFVAGFSAGEGKLAEAAKERDEKVQAILRGRHPVPGILGPQIVTRTLEGILADIDPIHGAFGRGPKLPLPSSLRLLAECVDDDPRIRPALTAVLDAVLTKGLEDRIEGGFFAGCAGDGWTRPSTEKLLDVNARMMSALLAAGWALGEKRFLEAGGRVGAWITGKLYDAERRTFAGAQAADEEYYSRDAEGRSKMAAPEFDRTAYTDRIALAASALRQSGHALQDVMGVAAIGAVLEGQADRHCEGGSIGLLRDRVALGHALLDLDRFSDAERIGARLLADYGSDEEQGLLDRRPGVEELGELSRRRSDPGETGDGARFLLRLAKEVNEPRYRADAERILRSFPDYTPDWGHATAEIASAVKLWLGAA